MSPSSDPPGELDINSGDEANVTQPDIQAVANVQVITVDTNAVNTRPDTEEVSNEAQETKLKSRRFGSVRRTTQNGASVSTASTQSSCDTLA